MPDSSGRAPVCANEWSGTWNHWIAPFSVCPRCRASLNWRQVEDALERPMVSAKCCGVNYAAHLTWQPPTASAPPRTEAPETRRSAYAFPIHACERCWHGESELTIHNKVLTACPKCGGTMREVGIPVTDAPQPCDLLCLVCARVKPWGIWDQTSGIAVCVECRDKARKPSPRAGEPETQWPITNLLGITPERWHEIVETASTEDPVVRYWCKACPLTFTDADTANAHHDATGHNQTHRQPSGRAPVCANCGSDGAEARSGIDQEGSTASTTDVIQPTTEE